MFVKVSIYSKDLSATPLGEPVTAAGSWVPMTLLVLRSYKTSLSPDQLPKLGRPAGRSAGKSKRYWIDLGSTERAKDE